VHVEGQYENGVLKLKVPKTEKTQARQIKID
jgi:HSP20 family molecular chaperone IbpA